MTVAAWLFYDLASKLDKGEDERGVLACPFLQLGGQKEKIVKVIVSTLRVPSLIKKKKAKAVVQYVGAGIVMVNK